MVVMAMWQLMTMIIMMVMRGFMGECSWYERMQGRRNGGRGWGEEPLNKCAMLEQWCMFVSTLNCMMDHGLYTFPGTSVRTVAVAPRVRVLYVYIVTPKLKSGSNPVMTHKLCSLIHSLTLLLRGSVHRCMSVGDCTALSISACACAHIS